MYEAETVCEAPAAREVTLLPARVPFVFMVEQSGSLHTCTTFGKVPAAAFPLFVTVPVSVIAWFIGVVAFELVDPTRSATLGGAVTVTDAVRVKRGLVLSSSPDGVRRPQLSVYTVVTEGETTALPFNAPPIERPPIEHDHVFCVNQVRVDDPPLIMLEGDAEKEATAAAPTVTVTYCTALEPPGPVQLTEYVVVVEGDTVTEPEVAPPVAKFALEQEVALEEVHVSSELSPEFIIVGDAESVAVAAGGTG